MEIEKQQNHNLPAGRQDVCPTGNCPEGIDMVKEIKLTPKEKRAIFFALKDKIFKLKKQRFRLLGRF